MITIIVGRAQMGKTSLMKLLIREHSNRLIIFDSNNEYGEYGLLITDDFKKLYERIHSNDFPIRFFCDDFNRFCVFLKSVKNFTLCVDELHSYAEGKECPKSFKELIRRHAHLNMSFFGAAHQITLIHRALRSQWTRLIIFQQIDFDDLNVLRKFGAEPESVRTLSKFKWIVLNR